MVVGVGHLLITLIFSSLVDYPLGRDNVSQVCDLSAEELALWGFEFKSGLFLEHGSSIMRWHGLQLLTRWLYHWGIWCTNWGWGSPRQVFINHWKVAGALVSPKGILSPLIESQWPYCECIKQFALLVHLHLPVHNLQTSKYQQWGQLVEYVHSK